MSPCPAVFNACKNLRNATSWFTSAHDLSSLRLLPRNGWRRWGFPLGPVYLGETQAERLALVKDLRDKFDFVAGIGDRWDDNELHLEIGCLSIILQEHAGDWASVPQHIERNLS